MWYAKVIGVEVMDPSSAIGELEEVDLIGVAVVPVVDDDRADEGEELSWSRRLARALPRKRGMLAHNDSWTFRIALRASHYRLRTK